VCIFFFEGEAKTIPFFPLKRKKITRKNRKEDENLQKKMLEKHFQKKGKLK
jgi:hypothetical protein